MPFRVSAKTGIYVAVARAKVLNHVIADTGSCDKPVRPLGWTRRSAEVVCVKGTSSSNTALGNPVLTPIERGTPRLPTLRHRRVDALLVSATTMTMMAHKQSLSNDVLDSRGRQVPLALVTEWGSESLRVICPYCLRYHCHGLGGPPLTRQTRAAHCGPSSGSYQLCYPFEEQSRV